VDGDATFLQAGKLSSRVLASRFGIKKVNPPEEGPDSILEQSYPVLDTLPVARALASHNRSEGWSRPRLIHPIHARDGRATTPNPESRHRLLIICRIVKTSVLEVTNARPILRVQR
jgi:hypothetical protein